MKTTAILASTLLMSVSTAAFAGEDWKGMSESQRNTKVAEKFMKLDTNSNGSISESEFTTGNTMSGTDFETADTDDNGSLTQAELRAFKEAKWMDKSQATNSNERMNNDGSRTSH